MVLRLCPDLCTSMGSDFVGNIRNPYNPQHFIQCANGKTHGCQMCQPGLVFIETLNKCDWS